MILTIPRPAYKTSMRTIAAAFGVSQRTLYTAIHDGRLTRSARVFTLEVRSAGTYNTPRAIPANVRCAWCAACLTKRQSHGVYCSKTCASRAVWYRRKQRAGALQ